MQFSELEQEVVKLSREKCAGCLNAKLMLWPNFSMKRLFLSTWVEPRPGSKSLMSSEAGDSL